MSFNNNCLLEATSPINISTLTVKEHQTQADVPDTNTIIYAGVGVILALLTLTAIIVQIIVLALALYIFRIKRNKSKSTTPNSFIKTEITCGTTISDASGHVSHGTLSMLAIGSAASGATINSGTFHSL
jgi:hypothetical protein